MGTRQDTPDSTSEYTRPSDEELRSRLTPLQYEVTQEEGTERPFQNAYWDEKREGETRSGLLARAVLDYIGRKKVA